MCVVGEDVTAVWFGVVVGRERSGCFFEILGVGVRRIRRSMGLKVE